MKGKKNKRFKLRLKGAILIFMVILGICAFNEIKGKTNDSADNKKVVINNKNTTKKNSKSNYLEKTVSIDSQNRKIVKNLDDMLVLANKERYLPGNYVPKDLVVPNVPFPFKEFAPKKQMRKEAAKALEDLFNQAKKEGMDLYAISGYRSYQTQEDIFDESARINGEAHATEYVAKPGQSEHQTGLAMDVTCPKVHFHVVPEFADTKEGKWLKENMGKYGFILRYPKSKEDVTGYSYEAWHIRYVGKNAAEVINSKDITLEEYLRDYK
jgi:D-alanyl-D-alanine carboxypeptidase